MYVSVKLLIAEHFKTFVDVGASDSALMLTVCALQMFVLLLLLLLYHSVFLHHIVMLNFHMVQECNSLVGLPIFSSDVYN